MAASGQLPVQDFSSQPGSADGMTYYGDANLDRTIDSADYSALSNGTNGGLTGWTNGDFNYDGVVDQNDTNLLGYSAELLGAPATQPATVISLSTNKVDINEGNTTTKTVINGTIKTNGAIDKNAKIEVNDTDTRYNIDVQDQGDGTFQLVVTSLNTGTCDVTVDVVLVGNANVKTTLKIVIRPGGY